MLSVIDIEFWHDGGTVEELSWYGSRLACVSSNMS